MDLEHPAFLGQIGISAPSRSGTTHVIVKLLLQRRGWDAGWASLLRIAGNLATVTARSTGVPRGVEAGLFSAGPMVDYLALATRDRNRAVDFSFGDFTVFLPASIALAARATNADAGLRFIDFLLSEQGQLLLLAPGVRRLPTSPRVYASAPEGFPNPFSPELTQIAQPFDAALSERRYHLVNTLFDALITRRHRNLRELRREIVQARADLNAGAGEKVRSGKRTVPGEQLVDELDRADRLLQRVPVSARQAMDSVGETCH